MYKTIQKVQHSKYQTNCNKRGPVKAISHEQTNSNTQRPKYDKKYQQIPYIIRI